MINRDNWLDTQQYLEYLRTVKQLDDQTVNRRREQLRHLLEWADDKPFSTARMISPVFPTYLLTARNDDKKIPLSGSTMKANCQAVRRFFIWARMSMPRKYSTISPDWLETIAVSRANSVQSVYRVHEFYSFEEMQRIAAVNPRSLREEREQAAMVFMFLSGVRVGAFVSLPISCVDIGKRSVDQFPEMGVRTKNHKAARTFMLPIPELLEIVQAWDDKVRSQLPADSMWYAAIDSLGENLKEYRHPGEDRGKDCSEGFVPICEMANVEYKSAHKLRHGHVVYGMKGLKDIASLKAFSQNIMHGSIQTTDRIYGNLDNEDIQKALDSLEPKRTGVEIDMKMMDQLVELAQLLIQHPELLNSQKVQK